MSELKERGYKIINDKYYLNGRGIPPNMVRDILENPTKVYKEIKNGVYTGKFVYEGKYTKPCIKGELTIKAIVSEDSRNLLTILTSP